MKGIGGWGPCFSPAWSFDVYLPQFDTFWTPLASVPPGSKGKNVKDGGALAYSTEGESAYVYALKGGSTLEFWKYQCDSDRWTRSEWPSVRQQPVFRLLSYLRARPCQSVRSVLTQPARRRRTVRSRPRT